MRLKNLLQTGISVVFMMGTLLSHGEAKKTLEQEKCFLTNGCFENFENNLPFEWAVKTYTDGFKLSQDTTIKAEGKSALRIDLKGGAINLGRKLKPLNPDFLYRISFKYKKTSSNPNSVPSLSAKISAKSKTKNCVWVMTPAEISSEWQEASKEFRLPPDAGKTTIGFVCYARNTDTKETIWLDDVKITKLSEAPKTESAVINGVTYQKQVYVPENGPLNFSEAEAGKGIFSFIPQEQDGLRPEYIPSRKEINQSLKLFSAQNCKAIGTFALYPLKDWKKLTVKISNLKDNTGKQITASEKIDIKSVRIWRQKTAYRSFEYYDIPELLDDLDVLDLDSNNFKQFLVTIDIPANIKVSDLTGAIKVLSEDKEILNIPLNLRVLDYNLEEAPTSLWGLYPDEGHWKRYKLSEISDELDDFRKHGINTLRLSPTGYIKLGKNGNSIITEIDASWTERLNMIQKKGFKGPFWCNIQSLSGLIENKLGKNIPPETKVQTYREIIEKLEKSRKDTGISEFIYQVTDEASSLDKRAVAELKLLHDMKLKTMSTISYEADQSFLNLLDYQCFGGMPYSEKSHSLFSENAKRINARLWWYGIGAYSGQEAKISLNRAGAGFMHWKTGFEAVWAWTFQRFFGSPYDDFDAKSKDACITYPHPDKNKSIPTLAWEGIREGFYDYNYIYTLSKYIELAKKSNDKNAKAFAEDSRKMLNEIIKSIPWKDAMLTLTNKDLQSYRWLIAERTEELRKVLNGNKNVLPLTSGKENISQILIIPEKEEKSTPLQNSTLDTIIPLTENAPNIDGKLDDECWINAGSFDFVTKKGIEPVKKTQALACHDEKFLYLAFKCEEPFMKDLKAKEKPRDADIWEDDCIEIFIDPEHNHRDFYHIAINSCGSIFDCKGSIIPPNNAIESDPEKNFNMRKAIKKSDDNWTIEIAIPFDDFQSRKDLMGINLCRESRSKETEISYWAPTYGIFHNITHWGHVTLQKKSSFSVKLKEAPLFGKNAFNITTFGNRKERDNFAHIKVREKNGLIKPVEKKIELPSVNEKKEYELELGLLDTGKYHFLIDINTIDDDAIIFSSEYPTEIPDKIQCSIPKPVITSDDKLKINTSLNINDSIRKNIELEIKIYDKSDTKMLTSTTVKILNDISSSFTCLLTLDGFVNDEYHLKVYVNVNNEAILSSQTLSFWKNKGWM